jgi:RND family efflux transporter MFP subunit
MSRNFLLKTILPVVIILVGIAAAKTLVEMRPHAAKHRPPTPQPLVDSFVIQEGGAPVHVRGFGTVKAKRTINVVPQVSGVVVEKSKAFEAGGYCEEGQVMLRIDDTDYILAFEKANADVAQAELNLARAEEEADVSRQEWDRIGKNKSGGSPTQASALVLHEPQLKLAQASLNAAQAARNQAKVNLNRCSIVSPFKGRVLTADVDTGQYLRAGNPVGVLYATDVAEVTISVADDDLAWISVDGTDCPKGPETTVVVGAEFAGARHQWEGRAVRLGGAVDAKSRLVPVVVEIKNPYHMVGNRPPLMEGMFVDVLFSGNPPEGSVVIPRTALRPGNKVWLIDPESKVRILEVDVTRAGVEEAVIGTGLKPGDRICTSNLQYVTDGMPVRVAGVPSAKDEVAHDGDAAGKGGA